MGYKILGWTVWKGAKWYLRRRSPAPAKLALMGVAGVAVAGLAVAGVRRAASS
jgi:xanthosine utilization system XapX-like protein